MFWRFVPVLAWFYFVLHNLEEVFHVLWSCGLKYKHFRGALLERGFIREGGFLERLAY